MNVEATEKLITKPRPLSSVPQRPVQETRSTHAAQCPYCGRETRVGLGSRSAVTYGACIHFSAIERRGEQITVQFDQEAA